MAVALNNMNADAYANVNNNNGNNNNGNNNNVNNVIQIERRFNGNYNYLQNNNNEHFMSRDTYETLSRACDNDNPLFYIEPKELIRRLREEFHHVDDNIMSMLEEYVGEARGIYHSVEMYDYTKNEIMEVFPEIRFIE